MVFDDHLVKIKFGSYRFLSQSINDITLSYAIGGYIVKVEDTDLILSTFEF